MNEDFSTKVFDVKKAVRFLNKNSELVSLVMLGILLLVFIRPLTQDMLLVHESPYNFVAGDMFWLSGYAVGMKETGSASIMPPYLTDGIENVAFFRPPVTPLTYASLSILSGIEVHDIEFNSNLLFAVLFIIITYVILREVSVALAIFSIPVAFLLLKWPFNYFITWGMQMSNFNFLFVIISVLLMFYIRKGFFVPLLSLFIAAGLYSHVRETIMFIAILIFYLIFLIIIKDKDFYQDLKKIVSGGFLGGIIFLPYLPFITQLPEGTQFHLLKIGTLSSSASRVVFTDLGWWNILLWVGVLLFIIILSKRKLSKNTLVPFSYAAGFVFSSFFTMLGNKITQIRHLIPVFATPFVGLVFIQLYKSSREKKELLPLFTLIMSLILASFFLPAAPPAYAVSNPQTHKSFEWINTDTPKDASFLVLFGDNFYQETLFYFLKRNTHRLKQDQLSSLIKNNTFFLEEIPIETVSYPEYVERKGLLSYKGGSFERARKVHICDYDYVYFNIRSQNRQIEQFNQALVKYLMQEFNFKPVYQNDLAIVLKNQGCSA